MERIKRKKLGDGEMREDGEGERLEGGGWLKAERVWMHVRCGGWFREFGEEHECVENGVRNLGKG